MSQVLVYCDKGRMFTSMSPLPWCNATLICGRNIGAVRSCRTNTRASTRDNNNNLFENHDFVRLLELPTSAKSADAFSQALAGGSFQNGIIHAIVSPDIRSAFSLHYWFPFFNTKLGITRNYQISAEEDEHLKNPTQDVMKKYWQVRTIAAQMRMPSYLRSQMVKAAKEIQVSGNGGSLLFVSGGHPFRRHWPIKGIFSDSFSLLHTAHGLRKSGLISPGKLEPSRIVKSEVAMEESMINQCLIFISVKESNCGLWKILL